MYDVTLTLRDGSVQTVNNVYTYDCSRGVLCLKIKDGEKCYPLKALKYWDAKGTDEYQEMNYRFMKANSL